MLKVDALVGDYGTHPGPCAFVATSQKQPSILLYCFNTVINCYKQFIIVTTSCKTQISQIFLKCQNIILIKFQLQIYTTTWALMHKTIIHITYYENKMKYSCEFLQADHSLMLDFNILSWLCNFPSGDLQQSLNSACLCT